MEHGEWLGWVLGLTRQDVSEGLHQFFWWLVLLTSIGMLFKIGKIRDIVLGIKDARSPIWNLRDTVDKIEKLEPVLKQFNELEPLIKSLGENLPLLSEKVDSSNRKLTELQLDSVGSRTDDLTEIDTQSRDGVYAENEDHWPALQLYWRRNTRRLEYVIENIPDGRKRLAIDRMSRTNYRAIINRLEEGKFLKKADANASRDLIDLFNQYRPRSRVVNASVVGPLENLDRQLDAGIVRHDSIADSDVNEISATAPPNQSGGFYPSGQSSNSAVSTDNKVAHQRR